MFCMIEQNSNSYQKQTKPMVYKIFKNVDQSNAAMMPSKQVLTYFLLTLYPLVLEPKGHINTIQCTEFKNIVISFTFLHLEYPKVMYLVLYSFSWTILSKYVLSSSIFFKYKYLSYSNVNSMIYFLETFHLRNIKILYNIMKTIIINR